MPIPRQVTLHPWERLMVACIRGNSARVSRLIKVPRLDINYQDQFGDTAAHLASYHGHTECLRILAHTGRVDWSKTDITGRTPLRRAEERGHRNVVEILKMPDIDFGETPATNGCVGFYQKIPECPVTDFLQKL